MTAPTDQERAARRLHQAAQAVWSADANEEGDKVAAWMELIDAIQSYEPFSTLTQAKGEQDGAIFVMDLVHNWFELTYAQYLTVPRSILQAMPDEWQARFVACLIELDATFRWQPNQGRYWVTLKDSEGHYANDPLAEYRHPNRGYINTIRVGGGK